MGWNIASSNQSGEKEAQASFSLTALPYQSHSRADQGFQVERQCPAWNRDQKLSKQKGRLVSGKYSAPLHVTGDMNGVILTLPEATRKEVQAFRDAIHQRERQNQTATKN